MPITQIATGRAFTYRNNIGQIGASGPSLRHPVGLARGANDILYVANWGTESQPNSRITKCVLSTQEWIADIGQPVQETANFSGQAPWSQTPTRTYTSRTRQTTR